MTRASDTAKLLGAGATILDGTTISTADNDAQLTLKSTDADATLGPLIDLVRDSGSPADNDVAGKINFTADNDAGEVTTFADTFVKLTDVSNGTEDATVSFRTMTGGSLKEISMGAGNLIFNESGSGVHLGVTSATASNLLNDYEEGTWTPSLGGNTSYHNQAGKYIKIGKLVHATAIIQANSLGTGSTTVVSGFPFASSHAGGGNMGGTIGFFYFLAVNVLSIDLYYNNGSTSTAFKGLTSANNTSSSNLAIFGNGARVDFAITYETS